MDPVTLATITSAVSVLATEVAKGAASEASKDLWTKIKSVLGWTDEPKAAEVAPAVAQRIGVDEKLAERIVQLLKSSPSEQTGSSQLVGNLEISGGKVVFANKVDVLNMN